MQALENSYDEGNKTKWRFEQGFIIVNIYINICSTSQSTQILDSGKDLGTLMEWRGVEKNAKGESFPKWRFQFRGSTILRHRCKAP